MAFRRSKPTRSGVNQEFFVGRCSSLIDEDRPTRLACRLGQDSRCGSITLPNETILASELDRTRQAMGVAQRRIGH